MKSLTLYDIRGKDLVLSPEAGQEPTLLWWIIMYIRGTRSEVISDSHAFNEIIYIRYGEGVMEINNTPHEARKGNLFIINPGETHRTYSNYMRQLQKYSGVSIQESE